MEEIWVKSGREEVKEEMAMEGAAKIRLHWTGGLEQSMAFLVSLCAVGLRLEVSRWRVLNTIWTWS